MKLYQMLEPVSDIKAKRGTNVHKWKKKIHVRVFIKELPVQTEISAIQEV